MSAPKRIQLRRTKGWRKPEGAIVVARPSRWGNPFKVGDPLFGRPDRARTVALYRQWVTVDHPELVLQARRDLAGHDLVCWCPLDQPCHADVLLELADAPETTT